MPRPSGQRVGCPQCPARGQAPQGSPQPQQQTHLHFLSHRCRHAMRRTRFLLYFLHTTLPRRRATTLQPRRLTREANSLDQIRDKVHRIRPRDDHESEAQEQQLRGNEEMSNNQHSGISHEDLKLVGLCTFDRCFWTSRPGGRTQCNAMGRPDIILHNFLCVAARRTSCKFTGMATGQFPPGWTPSPSQGYADRLSADRQAEDVAAPVNACFLLPSHSDLYRFSFFAFVGALYVRYILGTRLTTFGGFHFVP